MAFVTERASTSTATAACAQNSLKQRNARSNLKEVTCDDFSCAGMMATGSMGDGVGTASCLHRTAPQSRKNWRLLQSTSTQETSWMTNPTVSAPRRYLP